MLSRFTRIGMKMTPGMRAFSTINFNQPNVLEVSSNPPIYPNEVQNPADKFSEAYKAN